MQHAALQQQRMAAVAAAGGYRPAQALPPTWFTRFTELQVPASSRAALEASPQTLFAGSPA